MPAAALRLMSGFLLVIIVAVFGGDAIAGEASWGNLRYLLMRPISRGRLLGDEVRRRAALRVDRDRARGARRASSPV